jgi:phenylalanyl-tRNA synthetase beta chain
LLISNGAREIATYSFIGSKAVSTLGIPEDDWRSKGVKILNPLGDEYSTMRTQLITSMLTTLSTNYNRKIDAVRMFELSKIFKAKSFPLTEQPDEIPMLCLGVYGEDEDFFTIKGIIEELYESLGMDIKFAVSSEVYYHPGRQAKVIHNDNVIGIIGEIHPKIAEKYDINTKVYAAELELLPVYNFNKEPIIFKALPKYPSVSRDISLLCNKEILVGDLTDAIKVASGKLCEDIKLFDVYSGSQIPDGKKSVSFSLTLRSSEATLTDEQVEKVMSKVFQKLNDAGATLRM